MALIRKLPLTFFWCILIFVLCSVKMNYIPAANLIHIHNFDKLVHFLFFFILSLLIVYETGKQQNAHFPRILFSLLILGLGAFYGGLIELLQKYIFTYRSADWYDFAADVSGALVAVLIAPFFFKKRTEFTR